MQFCNKLEYFLCGKPFLFSLMCPGKARAYLSLAPFKYSPLVGSGTTLKHFIRLEMLANNKHSS